MIEAGYEVANCMRVMARSGTNVVADVLRGNGDFVEWDHYPPDDVFDPESRSQYYFHAHPPASRALADYGHFHTFLRQGKADTSASRTPGNEVSADEAISHLIGISVSREGAPERLFTTNRWVTGETWQSADKVVAMLDQFSIDLSLPSWPLNRWITGIITLFRPTIVTLLEQRDRAILDWSRRNPGIDVYEDRRLEILSHAGISVERQLKGLMKRVAD